jgi:hypothetical protein
MRRTTVKNLLLAFGACAAFATLVPAIPASAAMDLSTVDCSQASSMMMKPPDGMMKHDDAMMKPAAAMPAMTTDQAFDSMSHDMMQHATMMAGMELKCGKDAASRAKAAKLLQQLEDDGVMEAKEVLNTYNH